MDEPNKDDNIKDKFKNMLTFLEEQLSEPKFSNDFDETFKKQMPSSKGKEEENQASNSTMLKLIDFLKANEEVKVMATNLIKSELPNIFDSFDILKNKSSQERTTVDQTDLKVSETHSESIEQPSKIKLNMTVNKADISINTAKPTTTTTIQLPEVLTSATFNNKIQSTPSIITEIPNINLTTQSQALKISTESPLVTAQSLQTTPSKTPIVSLQTSVSPQVVTISETSLLSTAIIPALQNKKTDANIAEPQLTPKIASPILPHVGSSISPVKPANNIAVGGKKIFKVNRPNDDPIKNLEMSKSNLNNLIFDVIKNANLTEPTLSPDLASSLLVPVISSISPINQATNLAVGEKNNIEVSKPKLASPILTTVVTTISPIKPATNLAGRRKRNIEVSKANDDPIRDLEMSKFNLKKFIYDENKNDINLLHDLEQKINHEKREKSKVSFLEVKLFKVVQLLLIDAKKAGIKDPQDLFMKAIKTKNVGTSSQIRRRRSINEQEIINKIPYFSKNNNKKISKLELEQQVLTQIFRELDDLEVLSATNQNSLQRQDDGSDKPTTSTLNKGKHNALQSNFIILITGNVDKKLNDVQNLIPLATAIKDSLLNDVTTLLAKEAVKKIMNDQEKENKLQELQNKIASFISKTAVEKFFAPKHDIDKVNTTTNMLDDYLLQAESVKQNLFREDSSNEIFVLQEIPENVDKQSFVDSEEQLIDTKSPILYSVGNRDLKSDRVQEQRFFKETSPYGKGKISFTIPDGRDPTDWEIASSSLSLAERTVKGQDKTIDPSLEILEKAVDIVAMLENKP